MVNVKYILAIGSLLFTLAGCGGGGSVSNDDTDDRSRNKDGEISIEKSIGGIWSRNVSIDGTNVIDSIGLVAETGRFFFSSPQAFESGTFSTSESNFTGNLKAYLPDGETFATVNGVISGSFIEREQISGTSRFEDGTPESTFLYNYVPTYETPSSLDSIAGLYNSINEQGTLEIFTIDTSGAITGFSAEGCVANGDIKLVDTRYTIYDIQLVITACDTDRNISGLAAYLPAGGENDSDSLVTLADDGSAPVISILRRQ